MLPHLRALIAAVAILLASTAPADALLSSPPPAANLIVGFDGRYVDTALLAQAGAAVRATSEPLGIAAIYASDPAAMIAFLTLSPSVAWVENNGITRAESSQWDGSQWDASGWDASQWDGSQWDASQWDGSQWDASGWDASQWDGSQWDGSQWDGSQWDGSQWDASQWDASGWDASQWDASQWDASQWDASQWDGSQWDASQWDASQWDASQWDGSQWDASGWDSRGMNASEMTARGRTQMPTGTDPLVRWQWAIAAMNLSRADTLAPVSQTICIVDSGIDHTHPDLGSRYVGGFDFVNKDTDAMDDGGHGTHVAGIAAAASGNGLGITGTAPARLMAAKVLAGNGTGTEYDLAVGIDYCARNGANVISMSLGTPENSKAIHRAIVDAFSRGIVLVASAGNTGAACDCVRYPAAYPQVVSVGAVMPNSGRAPFSAVSHGVDLVAPGYRILSTVPGNAYVAASGTSQAAPFVAAAAAMLLANGADGAEATHALRDTAIDLGVEGPDSAFGYGSVNIGAALARVRST